MVMPLSNANVYEDVDEQLDFEDENYLEDSTTKELAHNMFHSKREGKENGDSYHIGGSTSSFEIIHSADEGELKSEEETDVSDDKSSEEGEVSSELEEMELVGDRSPTKEETPWERGLRLARERLERAKQLKAAEKDLVEKRMNLEVPTSAVDQEVEKVAKEDVFWSCYYQALIVGRTELTGHRFLPEDIQPPGASETAEWRRGLDTSRHGRRQNRYRRATSPSGSSSASSSSRFSSPASSSWSSAASSLASVAGSWKATCAKAMKDYLESPLAVKGRRGRYNHARWRRGQRDHSSRSSGSSSHSSDSRSPSDLSRHRGVLAAHSHMHVAGKLATQGVRRVWPEESRQTRRRRQGSNQSSGRSRTRSRSSRDSSDADRRRGWNYSIRGRKGGDSDQRSTSHESARDRREVPPLPHERPVKRPWVAAPGLATAPTTFAQLRQRTRSSSQSHSDSPPPADEKRFITSWSRSPSSGNERRMRDPVRRERLPDVVPGSHRALRGATPSRKKKSRSPFAVIHAPPVQPDIDQSSRENNDLTGHPSIPQPSVSGPQAPLGELACGATSSSLPDPSPSLIPGYIPPGPSASKVDTSERSDLDRSVPHTAHEVETATSSQTGGELPLAPNRPGVRLTLAPRLKASAIGIASLTGASSRSTNRSFQPSPPPQSRMHRLPLPPSLTERGTSPNSAAPNPTPLTAEQIRIQAEAAAAIVEARERRRAAAEAARRHRNPNRRKRNDLSKIPIRGRPTYRRQSFSSTSSSSSGHSSRSRSSAVTSARSKSASRSRSTSPQTPDSRCDDPYGLSNRPDYQPPRGHHARRGGGGGPRRAFQSNFVRDEYRDQSGDYYSSQFSRPVHHGTTGSQPYSLQSHDFPTDGGRIRERGDYDRVDRSQPPLRHRGGYEAGDRHRSYKSQSIKLGHDYSVDEPDIYPNPPHHKSDLRVAVTNSARYGLMHENVDQPRFPLSSRRVVSQAPPRAERVVRPRTPHGDYDEPLMDRRSPHLAADHRLRAVDRLHPRKDDRDLDITIGAPSHKRACIVSPPDIEPSILNPDMRRARTRHRSRGPGGSGAPIDRSEPFESDAGSFAAEQRLRELRERLNLVDDRIAEIKACSAR